MSIQPDDTTAFLSQLSGHESLAATDVKNFSASSCSLDGYSVRRREPEFRIVNFLLRLQVELGVVKNLELAQPGTERRFKNVPRVFQPVHVANFVPVKCRDRQLRNSQFFQRELNDD